MSFIYDKNIEPSQCINVAIAKDLMYGKMG